MYVKTGKVKLVYKQFPILDQKAGNGESTWAALAAECANEQGKFWEYHDKLFIKWLGENVGVFSRDNLKKYAADLKLDTKQFNDCLDTNKYATAVKADYDEAVKNGARGTPTFLLNDKLLTVQSLSYADFAKAFDAALK